MSALVLANVDCGVDAGAVVGGGDAANDAIVDAGDCSAVVGDDIGAAEGWGVTVSQPTKLMVRRSLWAQRRFFATHWCVVTLSHFLPHNHFQQCPQHWRQDQHRNKQKKHHENNAFSCWTTT